MNKKIQTQSPHVGLSFDKFLKYEGIFEEVQAKARGRAFAESVAERVNTINLLKIST
jgi:hypothetical protein